MQTSTKPPASDFLLAEAPKYFHFAALESLNVFTSFSLRCEEISLTRGDASVTFSMSTGASREPTDAHTGSSLMSY